MKLILVPWLFLGVLFPFKSAKPSSLELEDSAVQSVQGHLFFFEDKSSSLSLQEVINQNQWTVAEPKVFNKGYSESSWWLKLTIGNKLSKAQNRFLEVSYPKLNRVDFFILPQGSSSTESSYSIGNKISFSNRPIKHRFLIVPVDWDANEVVDVYIKVESSSSIQVPISLWKAEGFYRHDLFRAMIQAFYFGGVIVIALFNLLIYLSLREKTYFYYVCYIAAMAMFVACMNGFAFQYLWPEVQSVDDKLTVIFLLCIVLFGAEFTRSFLNLSELKPSMDFSAKGISYLSIILIIASLFLPYGYAIKLAIYHTVIAICYAYYTGIYAWSSGHAPAKYYTIAWSALLAGGLIMSLDKFNIVPKNLITDYSTQFGSTIEIILLSFAMAHRISTERSLRFEAQADALATQRKANEELERKVYERTRLIEEANAQLKTLSNTDQLTGLKNRRYMDNVFCREFNRCRRHENNLAIMVIDIDYFKRINDAYGHQVGDDCLVHTSHYLTKELRRPADIISRYGGEEFLVLLPETSLDGAKSVAEQMRLSLSEAPFSIGDEQKVIYVSIGLYSSIPTESDETKDFFRRADAALYAAKANGRNCVVVALDDEKFQSISGNSLCSIPQESV